jgi:hypothetical protein
MTAVTEQAAQLSAASDLLQRSLDRLAHLSDVRLLVTEVLTSTIEVAGAAGGALLAYDASTQALVLQSYVLDGLVLDHQQRAACAEAGSDAGGGLSALG